MKIMFLLGKVTNIGGISRVVSLLSDSLIKTGLYEVHVVGYLKEGEIGYDWNSEIQFYSLFNSEIPMKKGIFKANSKLRKLLRTKEIDVLVSCDSLFGPLGILSTALLKPKLVYWDHTNFFEETSHDFKLISKKLTARFCDVVVPLTKRDLQNFSIHTRAKRIEQIYNPIDVKLENLQHQYDLSSKKIISVGRLKFQKNFLLLVDVAKIVLDKHPDYTWHIFGSGPNFEKIKEKIKKNKLEGKLILKGQSNELYIIYKEYSMMVMTSRYEGFPMTLLEGLANKLPLVSFDIPTGPNEIIANDENGFLIESFNIEKMAERISELISNDEKRKLFSENSVNYMHEFKSDSITKKWVSLFGNLV